LKANILKKYLKKLLKIEILAEVFIY